MLASSKILPLNVDVETGNHTVNVNSETDMLSASSPKCQLSHTVHQPRTRNLHHHTRGMRKMPPKSPDLIELSDAGQSPVSVRAVLMCFFFVLSLLVVKTLIPIEHVSNKLKME